MDPGPPPKEKEPPIHQQVPHPDPSQRSLLSPMSGHRLSRIHVPPMSKSVKPGTDFYRACNDEWLKHTHLPRYRDTYSVSEELEEFLETFLHKIAQNATHVAKVGSVPRSHEGKAKDAIGRLVLSAMRPEKQGANVEYLKRALRSLSCMRDNNDIARTMAIMIRSGVPTILKVTIDIGTAATKGSDRYVVTLEPGSLGLPDPHHYLSTSIGLPTKTLLKKYREFLEFIGKEFDLDYNLANGISIESALAEPLAKFAEDTEIRTTSLAELKRKFAAIPWDTLFEALGISGSTLRNLGVISPEWLSILNAAFEKTPIGHWSLLLGIHMAVHGAPYLPPPFDEQHFQLFGKTLYGQAVKIPQHILTMNVLKDYMSDYMSYFFIKNVLEPAEKAKATKFVGTIFDATIGRLKSNNWMEEKTKSKCIRKVAAIRRSIFYPDPVRLPAVIPDLQTDNFLANIYLLNAAKFDAHVKKLSTTAVNTGKQWDEPAYTVNAYYYQEINQIVLPAGNFFWPFYDSGLIGWNYGGLGAVIAHEILHAFDEEGKDINEKGEEEMLWTAKDNREYERRIQSIVALFNSAKVGGIHVNGKLTVSENLADLGGLAIALDALRIALDAKKVAVAERKKELRDFFIAYAVSWRTKERPQKQMDRLYTDRHAPPQFRVNLIVSQFDEWYEAFGVVTGDALYVPPEERLRIF